MTETPGPRRSTRAASTRAGSATPAPSNAGRRSRGKIPKSAPLPAVPTATSHAYGARGKVSIDTQVDVSGGEGGFAEAFGARRGAAIDRDVEDDAPGSGDEDGVGDVDVDGDDYEEEQPVKPGRVSPSRTRQFYQAPISSSQRASARTYKRTFNDGLEDRFSDVIGGIPPLRHAPQQVSDEYNVVDEAVRVGDDALDDYLDDHIDVHSRTPAGRHQTFTELDTQFSYAASARGARSSRVAASLESPSVRGRSSRAAASLEPPPTREEIEAARPWSLAVLWETLLRWVRFPFTPFDELYFDWRSIALMGLLPLLVLLAVRPSNFTDIADQGLAFGSKLTTPWFRVAAPDTNLVHRIENLESDVRQIHKEIRSATYKLGEILPEHLMVQKNAATGEWELPANFWNALREKLADEGSAIAWDGFLATNKAKLDEAASESVHNATLRHGHIISQEQFIGRVEQIAGQVASRITTKLIKSLPTDDKGANLLYNLAITNLAHNTELAIQTVNYFSFGLGAVIDPYLTSPTHEAQKLSLPNRVMKGILYSGPITHPPAKVLQRWEEATDCWCAAASDSTGKAQVGVLMPRPIIPTSVTIEHIPARGTLDIGAAPKEFEVWVTSTEGPFLAEDGPGLDLTCGEQPGKDYTCIGKGNYNIHGPNHVQNFALEAENLVAPVNKAVVKIKNNWGKDYTCLYRIRMHGEQEAII